MPNDKCSMTNDKLNAQLQSPNVIGHLRLGILHWSLACAAVISVAAPSSAATCEQLAQASLPNTTITMAESVAPGAFNPGGRGAAAYATLPAFCRVAATLKPSPESDIKMELWLPASGWNGKFEAVGNGGWNGNIDTAAIATALRRGYAAASTDTGHQGGAGPWMRNREKMIDYGSRAVHEMTATSRKLIDAFYGTAPKFSYFNGCSAGGRQGLKAAQMYPADFDGIVAGAPALNATGRATFAIKVAQDLHRDDASYVPASKYPAIHDAVLDACDALDGVKDRVIENPRACKFDPEVLACKAGEDSASCLTPAQVASVRAMYQPAVNPRTRQVINFGLEPGSEMGWATFGSPQPFGIATQMFQFMVFNDPNWDYKTLNYDADMAAVDKAEGGVINARDPNLKAFVARGGKLIQYHGWADPQIPSGSSTDYYESVLKTMGRKVTDNYRLFMVPGMAHCGGGDGPASFDMLTALEQWVEQKKAPDTIPAAHVTNGQPDRTRILCPYPKVAAYTGSGDQNDAKNFVCR
jgi:feruloyl esterase